MPFGFLDQGQIGMLREVLQIALPWMNDPQGNYWLLLLVLPAALLMFRRGIVAALAIATSPMALVGPSQIATRWAGSAQKHRRTRSVRLLI